MTNSHRLVWVVLACLAVGGCTPGAYGAPGSSGSPPAGSSSPEPTPAPSPSATPTIPDGALLPNLVMEPLTDWQVEYQNEHRLLRVTTIFSNYGDGPFELRASRPSADQPSMPMDQIVYTASGGFRRVPTTVDARYAGDGHNHWHAQQVVTMELSPVMDPGSVRNGNKIHFCFFDNTSTNEALPGFNDHNYYLIGWCGTPDSFGVRMGLSVGWGDRYGWDFAGQWIDITDMAGGTYLLKATVDWANDFHETDDTDNCIMSRIQMPAAGDGRIITVEADSQPCPT